jgi:elongation factor 3
MYEFNSITLLFVCFRLGKGRRYGVMGKNGAGKTTLLTNIGTGNIEGLPTSLKTVYVQHDDASEDGGVSLIDELVSSKEMVASNVKKADAIAALKNINFTDTMLGMLMNILMMLLLLLLLLLMIM